MGNVVMYGLVALNMALYAISAQTSPEGEFSVQLLAEIFSSSAMILMACAMVLSNRPRFLERFFGGLDRMYRSHRFAGLSALVLLFLHFFTIPDLSAPDSAGRTLGKLALIGLTSLVALALVPRIPLIGGYLRLAYNHWRSTHRFIGLFFIVGFVHMLLVDDITASLPLARWYWQPIAVVGIAAYVYKELVAPRLVHRQREYIVEEATRLTPSVLEVALRPLGSRLPQEAGQFAFVRFPGDRSLTESHPFTISSAPRDELLRFSIRASGDWTRHLHRNLAVGESARVAGGFGRFSYKRGRTKQIWVAGGIGVTPFLSWMRDFDENSESAFDIEFFYTVRAPAEASFWPEIEIAGSYSFRTSLNVSSEHGQLSAEDIAARVGGSLGEHSVYLCGPFAMVDAMRSGFRRLGVPARRIRSEEFSFR